WACWSLVGLSDECGQGGGRYLELSGLTNDVGDRPAEDGVVGGAVSDDGAAPAPQFDEALVPQQLVGPQNGVNVDVERVGQFACRGQPFADGDAAGDGGCADAGGQLIEQRHRRGRVNTN